MLKYRLYAKYKTNYKMKEIKLLRLRMRLYY